MKFDMHYFLTAKYAKWIIIALISFFSLLIIQEFAQLIYSQASNSASPEQNQSAAPKTNQGSAEYIVHSSLFGVYVPDNLNENSVKKSMLDVTVVGIMFADNADDSQVILRSASGQEKTYKIGDTIPGGVKIERITAGGILVERDGTLESLSLPKNDLIFEPAPKPLKEEKTP